jgi:hypothetical protein
VRFLLIFLQTQIGGLAGRAGLGGLAGIGGLIEIALFADTGKSIVIPA